MHEVVKRDLNFVYYQLSINLGCVQARAEQFLYHEMCLGCQPGQEQRAGGAAPSQQPTWGLMEGWPGDALL